MMLGTQANANSITLNVN